MWEEVPDTFSGLQCNFTPRCPFCHTSTSLFDVKNLNFNVGETKLKLSGDEEEFLVHPRETSSHAVDVAMMCMKCGYHDIFGVAISYEHGVRNYHNVRKQIEKVTGKEYKDAVKDLRERLSNNRETTRGH